MKRAAVEDPVDRPGDRTPVGGHGREHEQAHPGQLLAQRGRAHPALGGRDRRAGANPRRRSCGRAAPGGRRCRRRSRASRVAPMMTDPRARGHTAAVPSIPGVPETILVAPGLVQGNDARRRGRRRDRRRASDRPAGRVDLCPVADGGEGTLDGAACRRSAASCETAAVSDPLGRPMRGFVRAGRRGPRSQGRRSSRWPPPAGCGLVPEGERDAFAASTFGTGELIAAARRGGRGRRLRRRRRERHHRRRRRRDQGDPRGRGSAGRQARRAVRRAHAVSRTRPGCSGRRRAPARTTSRG